MSSKSGISNNEVKQTDLSNHQNDKEKAIQNNSLTASQPPETILSSISKKITSSKLFLFLLSFCLPICSGCDEPSCSQCSPLMICVPNQPNYYKPKKEKERRPVGLITRNKEMELSGGKIIFGCTCGKKDGLSGGATCPRSCCMNNPGCYMNPPQCWPQFKETPKPPPIPERKMICIPIELVYYDPANK